MSTCSLGAVPVLFVPAVGRFELNKQLAAASARRPPVAEVVETFGAIHPAIRDALSAKASRPTAAGRLDVPIRGLREPARIVLGWSAGRVEFAYIV